MSRKKILIVDDSRIILRALSMKLTSSGYDVLTAEDGSDAVSIARKESPDIILLDLNFPPDVAHGGGVGWDGFIIMEWLRRMDMAKAIPIIVITGGDPAKFKDKAVSLGAAAFFRKPVSNDELIATIRKILGEDAPAATTPPTT